MTLFFLIIVLALVVVVVKEIQHNLGAVRTAQDRTLAEYLSESGLEIALHQFNFNHWSERETPFTWDMQPAKGGSDFAYPDTATRDWSIHLRVERVPVPDRYQALLGTVSSPQSPGYPFTPSPIYPYPLFKVTATGRVRNHRVVRTRYLNDASDLFRYVRNVYHFDFGNDRPRSLGATTPFGDEGVGVAGVVEERFTIPANGSPMQVGAVTDALYAGLVPEHELVLNENGEPLSRHTTRTSQLLPGEYRVSYPTGQFYFHPDDYGKTATIFYDYYHRVPQPPGPFVVPLPYPPVQANTDQVTDAPGATFYRDAARPRIMNHYFPDYRQAVFYLTEHNTNQPLHADYSFLGTRYTGSLRVNGNVRWANRNLIYLHARDQETVEATGEYHYEMDAHTILADERRRTIEINRLENAPKEEATQKLRPQSYRDHAPYHLPPFVGSQCLRRCADARSGGTGLYIANHNERESLSDPARQWATSTHLQPKGTVVDLSRIEPTGPRVILGEGNLRLVGALPQGVRLTVVSEGDLYIEDYLTPLSTINPLPSIINPRGIGGLRHQPSSLALIAQGNIGLNLTAAAFVRRPPDVYYLRALLWARQGTFGVIPGQRDSVAEGMRNQFLFLGSLNENFPYPNREWARAFSRLEWIFDPALRHPDRRPPYLFCWVSQQGD